VYASSRGTWSGSGFSDRERKPRIPTRRSVFGSKLKIDFAPRRPCIPFSGKMHPNWGPAAKTRDSNEPTKLPVPLSPLTWS
jgi:hypothetical protein